MIEKALWLYYAAQQPNTPVWAKTLIYGALAYFVLPFDAIPDVLLGLGFTDDMAVLLAAGVEHLRTAFDGLEEGKRNHSTTSATDAADAAAEAGRADEEAAAALQLEVERVQGECSRDLAAAEPLVAQAEAALDTLNKKDLGELKSLKQPPGGVDDVTACVVVLLLLGCRGGGSSSSRHRCR